MKIKFFKLLFTIIMLNFIAFDLCQNIQAQTGVKSVSVYCPNCGLKNNRASNFCISCGTRLKKSEIKDRKNEEFTAEILGKIKKSVVNIKIQYDSDSTNIPKNSLVSEGSGIVVNNSGYILTANHMVDLSGFETYYGEKAVLKSIRVDLYDGYQTTGVVVAQDEFTDLALIKISAPNLYPAELADADIELKVGDKVAVVGSPLGLTNTVTQGTISKLHRLLSDGGMQQFEDFIQIDTPINPGNSGGPLIDSSGKVIGIVTAAFNKEIAEGLGFAVPIWWVKKSLTELMKSRFPAYAWIGVWAKEEKNKVVVDCVVNKSPANNLLKEEDVILSIEDNDVDSVCAIQRTINKYEIDAQIKMKILRDNEEIEVKLILDKRPKLCVLPIMENFKIWGVSLEENSEGVMVNDVDIYNRKQHGITFSSVSTASEKKSGFEKGDKIVYIVPVPSSLVLSSCLMAAHSGRFTQQSVTDLNSLEKLCDESIEDKYLKMAVRIEESKQHMPMIGIIWFKLPMNQFL